MLSDAPTEIIEAVLLHLSLPDTRVVAAASRRLRAIASSPFVASVSVRQAVVSLLAAPHSPRLPHVLSSYSTATRPSLSSSDSVQSNSCSLLRRIEAGAEVSPEELFLLAWNRMPTLYADAFFRIYFSNVEYIYWSYDAATCRKPADGDYLDPCKIPPFLKHLRGLKNLTITHHTPAPSSRTIHSGFKSSSDRSVPSSSNQFHLLFQNLTTLTALTRLNLSHCHLSGHIPSEISTLSNLTWLWLSGNNLTGPIPDSMSRLSKLRDLRLDGNELSGAIPEGLWTAQDLVRLDVSRNARLRGPIFVRPATTTTTASNLEWVDLSYCHLACTFPKDMSSWNELKRLDVSYSNMMGKAPTSVIARLPKLAYLNVRGNRFDDRVPSDLVDVIRARNGGVCRTDQTGRVVDKVKEFVSTGRRIKVPRIPSLSPRLKTFGRFKDFEEKGESGQSLDKGEEKGDQKEEWAMGVGGVLAGVLYCVATEIIHEYAGK